MPEDLPQPPPALTSNQEFAELDGDKKQEWLRQRALDEILQTEQLYH